MERRSFGPTYFTSKPHFELRSSAATASEHPGHPAGPRYTRATGRAPVLTEESTPDGAGAAVGTAADGVPVDACCMLASTSVGAEEVQAHSASSKTRLARLTWTFFAARSIASSVSSVEDNG